MGPVRHSSLSDQGCSIPQQAKPRLGLELADKGHPTQKLERVVCTTSGCSLGTPRSLHGGLRRINVRFNTVSLLVYALSVSIPTGPCTYRVGAWAFKGFLYIVTLGAKYILYRHLDPFRGSEARHVFRRVVKAPSTCMGFWRLVGYGVFALH